MLGRFYWEIYAWLIPLIFVTGWILGYAHFWKRLRRKHRDLYDEWYRRTHGSEPPWEDSP